MNFPYTSHHQQGVACVDCHLEHMEESVDREPHSMPDHSFNASLKTCNTCHADQMHAPLEPGAVTGQAAAPAATANTGPTPGVQAASITAEPSPVSPLGYAILAALIGLAGGMVLAPWLERFYRRITRHEDGKHG